MAQVRLLLINSDGVPQEHALADDVTFGSFTVNGGGPVLSSTGLDMNNQDVTDVNDLAFNDPTTGTINQTAGALIIDNLMAKERDNVMTTAGAILFPSVTNTAGQLDSFKIPHLAGVPSATPTFSSDAGYMVFDSTNKDLYMWDGTAWDNLNTVESANSLDNDYTAEVAVAARDAVYISSADSVSPAQANSSAYPSIGFATASALAAASVTVRSSGILTGFSGLTPGSRYYLSAATAGAIVSSAPTGAGHYLYQMGYAKSATTLHIQIDYLGRRAL